MSIIKLKPKPKPPLMIGVVVQARMTSKRFPGKSMELILDKPVLQWVLERALKIRGPKKSKIAVILAVPDDDASEPMLVLADKMGVTNFCGQENNVLRRYYECARLFNLDVIVRITGDCPFIDPKVCSEILQLLIWRKLDYASNIFPKRTYAQGLDCEVFTFDALEAAYKLANSPYDLEHVTPWMQRTEGVRKGNIEQALDQSHKNWCVDYPEDIQRLEEEIRANTKIMVKANDNE